MIRFKSYLNEAKKKDNRKWHFAWRDHDLVKIGGVHESGSTVSAYLQHLNDVRSTVDKHSLGDSFENATPHHFDDDTYQMSPHEMAHWHKHIENMKGEMGNHYEEALMGYKGSSRSYANNPLRDQDNHHDTDGHIHLWTSKFANYKQRVDNMDKLTSAKTIVPMHGYRGFADGVGFRKYAKVGDVFQDHGFTGLSLKRHIANTFAGSSRDEGIEHSNIAKIYLPVGTKGHYIDADKDSGLAHEDEFVLHRGTHFRVLGHTFHKSPSGLNGSNFNHHILHLEVVGQYPKPTLERKKSVMGSAVDFLHAALQDTQK